MDFETRRSFPSTDRSHTRFKVIAVLGAGPYLLEARFTLGPATVSDEWAVTIRVGLDAQLYNCELWVSSTYSQANPGVHFNRKNSCGDNGAWDPGFSDERIAGADGESFVLMFWHDGTYASCALFLPDGTLVHKMGPPGFTFYQGCVPSAPDRFFVRTKNREARLHWVHVFATP